MFRPEVETFKSQYGSGCFRDNDGCSKCMNEIPCTWYLNFSRFLDSFDEVLQSFLGSGFSSNKRFLILKEGIITKLE